MIKNQKEREKHQENYRSKILNHYRRYVPRFTCAELRESNKHRNTHE